MPPGEVLVQVQSMGGNFDWKASVALFASTFVASGATYQHFWVPIGKTDVPPLATATANFGIGTGSVGPGAAHLGLAEQIGVAHHMIEPHARERYV